MTTVLCVGFPISQWLIEDEPVRRQLLSVMREEAIRLHTEQFGVAPTNRLRFAYERRTDRESGRAVYEIRVGV